MDHLTSISVFIRVAEEGSFSAAARSMKMTQPSVSKAIAELERRLGARLLHRTTRTLSLTEVGTTYYEKTKSLVLQLDEAERQALEGSATVQGRLRINTAALLAGRLVVPAVVAFRNAYPAVNVEVIVDDKRIDPVEKAMDVAVRLGSLADSSLRVRRAGLATVGAYAAPSYLEARGIEAQDIRDFSGQQVIQYIAQRQSVAFGAAEAIVAFKVSNALVARDLMLAGTGIAMMPAFLVSDDVRAGTAVAVLSHLELPASEVNILHPFSQDAPNSVSAFLDFAINKWRAEGLLHA